MARLDEIVARHPMLQSARTEISAQGYTRCPLPLDRDIASALSSLASAAWTIPKDPYYEPGNRFRTLNRYNAEVTGGEIVISAIQERTAYVQSSRYNTVLGGIERRYEALSSPLSDSRGLIKLIALHLARLPMSTADSRYLVNMHLMRFSATADRPCDTSPPGFHKDGEKYISVNLLTFCGAAGGEVVVSSNDKLKTSNFSLREMGEGYTIDDEAVWHMLTPVTVTPVSEFGIRDILLFDFLPDGWKPLY